MSQQAATTIGQNLGTGFFRFARFILAHPHGSAVTAALIISIVSVQLFRFYDQSREPRRIEFLSGPFGGSGYAMAASLAEHFTSKSRPFPDVPIQLQPTSSDGFEANRTRIDRDADGRCIGFAHDGFLPTDNVKVLLPLEYNRLHIIVSEAFYNAAISGHSGKSDCKVTGTENRRNSRCVGQIVHFLKHGTDRQPDPENITEADHPGPATDSRNNGLQSTVPADFLLNARRNVFLGPTHSGTRQVADLVMHHYGINIEEIDSQLELNWNQLFYAMTRGDIHMAFIVAEPSTSIIQRLAHRGGFFLLGLDDASGIAAVHPHIRSVSLERHSYGAMNPSSAFCNSAIDMIATRRVIIASSRMSSKDAFYLTTHLQEALESMGNSIRWPIPIGKEEKAPQETLIYSVHPGAKFVKEHVSPWYTFIAAVPIPVQTAFWWIVLSFILYPLANAFQFLQADRQLASTPPDRESSADIQSPDGQSRTGETPESDITKSIPSEHAVKTLKRLLGKIEASIDDCICGPLDKAEWDRWKKRFEHMNQQSVQMARSSGFDENQMKDLTHALSVLESEIDACRPVTSRKSRRTPVASNTAT